MVLWELSSHYHLIFLHTQLRRPSLFSPEKGIGFSVAASEPPALMAKEAPRSLACLPTPSHSPNHQVEGSS